MTASRATILPATSAADVADVARLFRAYAATLDIDLSYQGFDAELAALPGDYAPPRGALFLARDDIGAAIGCVALREMADAGCCEMKRLFVTPDGRGLGLGRALSDAAVAAACAAGYRELRLDTLPSMAAAHRLYDAMGFEATAPYYATPVAGTLFYRLDLTPPPA